MRTALVAGIAGSGRLSRPRCAPAVESATGRRVANKTRWIQPAVPVATVSAPLTTAHAWFTEYLSELTRRAQGFARRFARRHRDDAVADIPGQIFRYSLSAAARGKLALLTPFALVSFFGRAHAAGRQLAGTDT